MEDGRHADDFQNARAKLRKSRGDEDAEEFKSLPSINGSLPPQTTPTTRCEVCSVDFGAREMSVQEHLLSDEHIGRLREHGLNHRGGSREQDSFSGDQLDDEPVEGRHESHTKENTNEGSASPPPSLASHLPYLNLPTQMTSLTSLPILLSDPTLYGL